MSVEFISLNFVARRFITAILILSWMTELVGQTKILPSVNNAKHLNWLKPISKSISENEQQSAIVFDGAQYDYGSAVPFIIETCDLDGPDNYPIFTAAQFETVTDPKEIELLIQSGYVFDKEINIEQNVKIIRKKEFNYCKFFPFRTNKNGGFEKLVSYSFQWKNSISGNKSLPVSTSAHANSSVLSSGRWFKLSVSQNGIYKIDKDFLFSMGVDASSIDPKNIRIYGNGGKPLPESNFSFKPDDLIENAIFVEGESDGSFDSGDYILFYGQSPLSWLPQSNGSCMKFRHKSNPYSDNSYYFLTVDLGPGKRVNSQQSLSALPTHNVTSFDDYQLHESNSANLIKSGREWYGESFDILTSYSFNFNFPNIVTGDTVGIEVAIANRMGSTDPNAYSIIHPGGSTPLTTGIVWLNNYTAAFAADGSACASFLANGSSISVSINKNNSSALGWLNYIRVNARRNLIATSNLAFGWSR
jgi:hypothetical protein